MSSRAVTLRDIAPALLSPRSFYARVEDVAGYGGPLVVLLVTLTVVGYATVQTGLIDRAVDQEVERQVAQIEKENFDVVERLALTEMIADCRKGGEFTKLMARAQRIVAAPVGLLASLLLTASLFYGLVALTGKKPEWHTLMTIVVFAGFAVLLGAMVELGLMMRYRRLEVDTSLGLLAPMIRPAFGEVSQPVGRVQGLLTAVDPFRVWFWILVATGLSVTGQLRGWRSWVPCTVCWLGAAGVRAAGWVKGG